MCVCVFHLFVIDACMIKAIFGKWPATYWSLFPNPLVSYWVATTFSASKHHSLTQIHTHTHTMTLLIRGTCTVSLYENAPFHCLQQVSINRLMPYQVMLRNKGTSCMYAQNYFLRAHIPRHEHTRIHSFTSHTEANAHTYVCVCLCEHVCTCIYMFIYIYIYIYIYIDI